MLEIKCALCWNMHSVISLLWYNVVLMHVDRVHAHWLGVKLQHIYIYKKNIILNAHVPLKCYCLHSKKITMAVPMGHKEPIDMKLHISETFLFHQLEISGIPQVWRLCTQRHFHVYVKDIGVLNYTVPTLYVRSDLFS